jgi:hypothetical protein
MRIIILLITISLSGCSTTGMENFMKEMWIIKSVEYNNQKYDYGQGLILLNVLRFDSNDECEMPGWLKSRTSSEKGKWSIDKINGKYFLDVKNCTSEIYNNRYEIVIKGDKPKLITLESDSLKFLCAEVQIIGDN